ncbi:glutathione S-transferase [Mycobacterium szulgai]|uniref:Glutathione S-transferase n=1 Tax=Mycobacterium szulgai TaxID=1787 RepID=A0A1X2DI38_MYCSZ|nr:glutathione S-transferase [Mycobacterium szulgai]
MERVCVAPQLLVHICGVADWDQARDRGGIYPGPGEEFIHLSTPEQVHLPANRLYRGRADLLLLHIDPAALYAPVRWERGVEIDPESMLFPHLYGPLPVSAVIKAVAYPPAADGTFPVAASG